jgi:dipeptide transport system permease protein
MALYILRRFAMIPAVLLLLSLGIFALVHFIPADIKEASRIELSADPFYKQYGEWLGRLRRGDLGYSRVFQQPVLQVVLERLPASAELAVFAFIPVMGFGIGLGTVAALNRGKALDRLISTVTVIAWSTPAFVCSIWLLVIFYGGLGLFGIGRISDSYTLEMLRGLIDTPTQFMTLDALLNNRMDMLFDALNHLVLPVTTVVFVSVGRVIQVMRAAMLEVLSKDYIRTARAKGLSERRVTRKHARKNALIPVITVAGLTLSSFTAGLIIVEAIFDIDGLGAWFTVAAAQLDVDALVGFALLIATITLLINLVVDILYGLVDPRIRYD